MAVIKSKIRGHGRQLAAYLTEMGENEEVRILDVDGMADFDETDLKELLKDFSRNELLTKSRQGIYHATINPPDEASLVIRDADWLMAADILAEEIGFSCQRRAIVLHQKHGRRHIHVAFERYDHEKSKMIPIDHNYRKQDKARAKLEQVFNLKPTSRRNPDHATVKQDLTALWTQSTNAMTFLNDAKKQGYVIASGYDRIPFMVVNQKGRAFNLVRHLNGIKTKEVRDRFRDIVLPNEREAIAFIRTQEAVTGQKARQEKETVPGNENALRNAFMENLTKMHQKQQQRPKGPRMH